MAAISSFSGSISADVDCVAPDIQPLLTKELMDSPRNVANHSQGRVTFRPAAPRTSNSHISEQKPWGSGSPRRHSTLLDRTQPATLCSPSKKCFGAPDLLTSKRSEGVEKKTLAELRRETKFPLIEVLENRPYLIGSTPAGNNRNDKNKWVLPRPNQYTASDLAVTSASSKTAKNEIDLISEVLISDLADDLNANQDGGINTCTASNIQTIHNLTKLLCEIDDFDEFSSKAAEACSRPFIKSLFRLCSSGHPMSHVAVRLAKLMCSCEVPRNEMIAAGAVKTFFELVCDQNNELMQTLCIATIHTLLGDAEAVRRASKCRAAETILQVLRLNADNEFWNQRSLVLSICSRLLFNRLVQISSLLMSLLAGTMFSNFIPKQFEWVGTLLLKKFPAFVMFGISCHFGSAMQVATQGCSALLSTPRLLPLYRLRASDYMTFLLLRPHIVLSSTLRHAAVLPLPVDHTLSAPTSWAKSTQ